MNTWWQTAYKNILLISYVRTLSSEYNYTWSEILNGMWWVTASFCVLPGTQIAEAKSIKLSLNSGTLGYTFFIWLHYLTTQFHYPLVLIQQFLDMLISPKAWGQCCQVGFDSWSTIWHSAETIGWYVLIIMTCCIWLSKTEDSLCSGRIHYEHGVWG